MDQTRLRRLPGKVVEVRSSDSIADAVTDTILTVAAEIVMPRFGTLQAGDVAEKHPGDLVTIADREAEAAIARAIRDLRPTAFIVGEEQVFADPTSLDGLATAEDAWVIDPVDGTRNFANGSPNFAIMVAHVRAGTTVEGWIYQPVNQAMYQAESGAGVRLGGEPVVRRAARERLLGSAYVRLATPPDVIDLVRGASACGIDYPRLVEGEFDFLLYREGKPWDHLAGALMTVESGGRSATLAGDDYRPGVTCAPLSVVPADQWELVRTALAAK
ncbi:MAG: inositol monophosphatase [Propionibacteriaceae bacterium]|jgi:fructose-1,6-bisphosphatase/inositol monophosphatase family enzyme|nr:inositol monophosphatase [Propionibacteriaceae bacterium]